MTDDNGNLPVVALDPEYCRFIKEDGRQCGQRVGAGETVCFWHDPERTEEAQAARERGREVYRERLAARPRPCVPGEKAPEIAPDLEGLVQAAAWGVRAIIAGDLDAKQAGALFRGLDTLHRLVERQSLEAELIEARAALNDLKRAAEIHPRRRGR